MKVIASAISDEASLSVRIRFKNGAEDMRMPLTGGMIQELESCLEANIGWVKIRIPQSLAHRNETLLLNLDTVAAIYVI